MLFVQLSIDLLRAIIEYLELEEVARLHATNDRSLSRRIFTPGANPRLRSSRPSPLAIQYLCAHSSLKELSLLQTVPPGARPVAFEFEHMGNLPAPSLLPCRLLVKLPRTLTSLEIPCSFGDDPWLPNSTETFASLFPELKRLVFSDWSAFDVAVHVLLDQLLTELPPQLETLALNSAQAIPRFEVLPSSLTALHIMSTPAVLRYSEFTTPFASFRLIERLNTKLPRLSTLSLHMATHAPQTAPPPSQARKMVKLLPNLTSLNLQASHPMEEEIAMIILSVSSSLLTLAISGISMGIDVTVSFDGIPLEHCPPMFAYPSRLVSLTLAQSYPGGGPFRTPFSLAPSAFSTLPRSLTSLTVMGCQVQWASKNQEFQWEPTQNCLNGVSGIFHSAEAALAAEMDGAENERSWLSLLPPSITELRAFGLPIQVSRLPANIKSLQIHRCDENPLKGGTRMAKDENFKSSLSWPKDLTSLALTTRFITCKDALSLPPSLTRLIAMPTADWCQDDAQALLEALPLCHIQLQSSHLWITGYPVKKDEEDDLSTPQSDQQFSIIDFVQTRLRHLPPRLDASWKLLTADAARDFLATKPRVQASRNVTSIHLPASVSQLLCHGTLLHDSAVSASIISGLGDSKHLLEVCQTKDSSKTVPFQTQPSISLFGGQNLPTLVFDPLSTRLTTLILPDLQFQSFALPQSLTVLVLGRVAPSLKAPDFKSWRVKYRNQEVTPPEDTFWIQKEAVLDSLIDDFPRGLIHLEWHLEPLRRTLKGEWPPGLTKLSFTSCDWTDADVMKLSMKHPAITSLMIAGNLVAYGSQPISDDSAEEHVYSAPHEDSSAAEEAQIPILNSASVPSIMAEVVSSLDSLDLNTLSSAIKAPLQARNIQVCSIRVPSPLVFATDSTHTIILNAPNSPDFVVQQHLPFPKNTLDGMPAIRAQDSLRQHHQWDESHSSLPPTDWFQDNIVRYQDDVVPSIFSNYPCLTSLTINILDLTWDQVSSLPPTLKHLAVVINDILVVDPFDRLPRQLEALHIDSARQVVVSAEGFEALPPGLTTLECNGLSFRPFDIPAVPRRITTLLFHGRDVWTDLDVFELKRHLGDELKMLDVGDCGFSGALVPLSLSPHICMREALKATSARLGPKVKVIWLFLTTPLRFHALDLAQNVDKLSSEGVLSLTTLPAIAPASIETLDLSRAYIYQLCSSLPPTCMPTALTTLDLRFSGPIQPRKLSTLPATLKHFTLHITTTEILINPMSWATLPRALESFTVVVLGHESLQTEQGSFTRAFATIEGGMFQIASLRKLGVKKPYRGNPSVLQRLEGLPTKNLHTLSLRGYGIGNECVKDFGPALRILKCFDFSKLDEAEVAEKMQNITVERSHPGALQFYHWDTPQQGTNLVEFPRSEQPHQVAHPHNGTWDRSPFIAP